MVILFSDMVKIVVHVHRFKGSGFKGSVGLALSLFADIPRIWRSIGRERHNTRKFIKPIFAFSRNRVYCSCYTVFAATESDNNLQSCTQTT